MRAIMADNDIQGHMAVLMQVMLSETWREFWLSLQLPLRTFQDLSLPRDTSDSNLWHACQREEVVLITGNRNEESSDSLQATIQAHNMLTSLPVMTISTPRRVLSSPKYAGQVAESLLQYLLDIDKVRGAGRL